MPRPERLSQLDIVGLPTTFPPLRAARPDPGDLPDRLTSFLGREREVDDLVDLASMSRLVTLTGPGGIGKSSLAVEAARRLGPTYRDGAWFVPLATVDDPAAVEASIARSIGLFDGPERSAATALAGYLAERAMLLVLDNFEQVLEAAGVVAAILRSSPETRLLVTSRAPLRLVGRAGVPGAAAGWRAGAVHRACASRCGPAGTPATRSPSSTRSARSWTGCRSASSSPRPGPRSLPVTAIRDRLAAHLPLPGSGPRDVPARQRTLEGTVAWSHDLLRPELQTVLHDVAVFDGGFDLAEATVVLAPDRTGPGETLDDLLELAEHSLVARDQPDGDAIRFRLLRTIGDVALAKLVACGRETEVRRRHANAYLALAREAAGYQATIEQATWMHRLSHDDANLRSAVRWAIDAGEAEIALGLVGSLWRYWQMRGHLVGGPTARRRGARDAGGRGPLDGDGSAPIAAAGNIAYWQGRRDRGATLVRRAGGDRPSPRRRGRARRRGLQPRPRGVPHQRRRSGPPRRRGGCGATVPRSGGRTRHGPRPVGPADPRDAGRACRRGERRTPGAARRFRATRATCSTTR